MFLNAYRSLTIRLVCQKCKSNLSSQQIRNSQIVLRRRIGELKESNYNKILNLEDSPKSVIRIRKDPRDKIILLFGGEESYYVGMCEQSLDNPQIYEMFEKAEQVFGFNLMDMCLNGPIDKMRKTKYLLPCVFLANQTAFQLAKTKINQLEQQTVAATSSGIGELNALVFNDVISFDDALKFLKVRTDAMSLLAENSRTKSLLIYESAATKPKFMCTAAKEWCLRKGIDEKDAFCEITHWLHPETKIIGGHQEAIDFIVKNKENFALKRTFNLPFDLAYYSSYLYPIREILKPILDEFTFQEPTIKIHSTTGETYNRKNLIKNLADQVYKPVRLETNFSYIYLRRNGIYPRTIECAARRTNSVSLRSANFQAYRKMRTVLAS